MPSIWSSVVNENTSVDSQEKYLCLIFFLSFVEKGLIIVGGNRRIIAVINVLSNFLKGVLKYPILICSLILI